MAWAPLETNVPGLFAVGDIRSGSIKQVAASVGEGAQVVAALHLHFAEKDRLTTSSNSNRFRLAEPHPVYREAVLASCFAPGQSGNPSGRPKRDEDIAALARTHTEDAIAVLVSIAENPKANDNARISAANSLLDRGHGKPPQAVAVKTESNNDTFVRLWRYLTVGEMVAEAKDVTD